MVGTVRSSSNFGLASATSLAIGGATIGSNALAVTGTSAFSALATFSLADALTTSAGIVTSFSHTTSGTAGAQFGSRFQFNLQNASGSMVDAGGPAVALTVATNAAETSNFQVYLKNGGGALTSVFTIAGNGALATANIVSSSNISAAQSSAFFWTGRSQISSPENGGMALATNDGTTAKSFISVPVSATFQHGQLDAVVAVAQTLRVQSVVAGTVNGTVGADWTFGGSSGTGQGKGGNYVFNLSPAASGSATTQNAGQAALTLYAPPRGGAGGTATQKPSVVVGNAALATTDTDGFIYIPTCAGTPTGTPTAFTGRVPLVYDTTADILWVYSTTWKQPKTVGTVLVVDWV